MKKSDAIVFLSSRRAAETCTFTARARRFHNAELIRPPRVSKLMVVELSGKNNGLLSRVLAIGGAFFTLGQYLTQFWGSEVKFSRNRHFFNLSFVYFKTINRSDIKLSLACCPFNSEQNKVSLQFIDGIFVTHSITEGLCVTITSRS